MNKVDRLIEKMKQEGTVTPSMGNANGPIVRDFCIQLVEEAMPGILLGFYEVIIGVAMAAGEQEEREKDIAAFLEANKTG